MKGEKVLQNSNLDRGRKCEKSYLEDPVVSEEGEGEITPAAES